MTSPSPRAVEPSFLEGSIAETAERARQLLLCCRDIAEEAARDFAAAQLARFQLWASNMGVFGSRQTSLDYRLRTALTVRAAIEGNLDVICKRLLTTLKASPNLSEDEYDALYVTPLPQISSFAKSLLQMSDVNDQARLQELSLVEEKITTLHQLSLAIRRASNRNSLAKVPALYDTDKGYTFCREPETQDDPVVWTAGGTCHHGTNADVRFDISVNFEEFVRRALMSRWLRHLSSNDEAELGEENRRVRQILLERCVTAVSMRRRQLAYFRSHQRRIEQERVDKLTSKSKQLDPNLLQQHDASVKLDKGKQLDRPLGPTGLSLERPDAPSNATHEETVVSEFLLEAFRPPPASSAPSSTASTTAGGGFEGCGPFEVPPPPKLEKYTREKACPYCCLVLPAKTFSTQKRAKRWERHILEDLQPYICLFANCSVPGRTYSSFTAWQAHLGRPHYHSWRCSMHPEDSHGDAGGGGKPFTFDTLSKLQRHLKAFHPDLNPSTAAGDSLNHAPQLAELPEWCFVCLEQTPSPAVLQQHVAKHLKNIFILALPWRDDLADDEALASDGLIGSAAIGSNLGGDSSAIVLADSSLWETEANMVMPEQAEKVGGHEFSSLLSWVNAQPIDQQDRLETWASDQRSVTSHQEIPEINLLPDSADFVDVQLPRYHETFRNPRTHFDETLGRYVSTDDHRQEQQQSIIEEHGHRTPVSTQQQLPSPVTHDISDDADLRGIKEATATPPEGRPSQATHRDDNYSQAYAFSSPPQDTHAFSQNVDLKAALSDEVEDEVKEGVWGYLFPMDARHGGQCVVLRKRTTYPDADTVAQAVPTAFEKGARWGQRALIQEEESFEKQKVNGLASGGYLIGRHPECDIVIEDPVVSNRHCLLFNENRDQDSIAVLVDFSANGTFVNEAIVGRNYRRELQEGDEIAVLDKASFIFRYPKSRHTSAFLQQYQIMDKLSRGHFASVHLCVERSTGERYAVKIFSKTPGVEEHSKNEGLQREIAVLMGVSHPNLLCLKDAFNEPTGIYLVLELASEGELFNYIVKHKDQKLSEGECRKLFTQLFQAVKYLHNRNIVHRDIKPENILLVDQDLHIKLADFSLAKIIGEESFITTLCGTPSYLAPEILADNKQRKYTKAVDIWSLGVVLYICLCGFPPFSDELYTRENPYTLSQQIRKGIFDYPSPYWDSVSDPALDLIDSMLVVNPDRRFTIDQCLSHPWMLTDTPGVNESTNWPVSADAGLHVNRRGVFGGRTLLGSINTVQVTGRVPMGPNRPDLKIYSKNPRASGSASPGPGKEVRPSDQRDPREFMELGGKGYQELYGNNTGSRYSKNELPATQAAAAKKGKEKGNLDVD